MNEQQSEQEYPCGDDSLFWDEVQQLEEEVQRIKEESSNYQAYRFRNDLNQRMERLHLDADGLAGRLGCTSASVRGWQAGTSRPNGREPMKKLGMALEMDKDALNQFLKKNRYPPLYVKNPLDNMAEIALESGAGQPDIVETYDKLLSGMAKRVKRLTMNRKERESVSSTVMYKSLLNAMQDGRVSEWRRKYEDQFVANEKEQLPPMTLSRFVSLYIDITYTSVNQMMTAGISRTLQKPISHIRKGSPLAVRPLREQLIAFGFFCDMTEYEIDFMLGSMKLPLFTEPVTVLDYALVHILDNAHLIYPPAAFYHYQLITERLCNPHDEAEREILDYYRDGENSQGQKYADIALAGAASYEAIKGDAEEWFVRAYTTFEGKCFADYAYDTLAELLKRKALTESEVAPIMNYLKRKEEDADTPENTGENDLQKGDEPYG